jgi:hypothetical protein
LRRVETDLASEAIGDVAEMTERGREVRLLNLGVQELGIAGADRVRKIWKWFRSAGYSISGSAFLLRPTVIRKRPSAMMCM